MRDVPCSPLSPNARLPRTKRLSVGRTYTQVVGELEGVAGFMRQLRWVELFEPFVLKRPGL